MFELHLQDHVRQFMLTLMVLNLISLPGKNYSSHMIKS